MLKKDRKLRKTRIRSRLAGTADRPRVNVFRSNKTIYAQAIDDDKAVTLATASSKGEKSVKTEASKKVGESLAEKLTKLKIKQVVFDRSGYKFHGRVKAVAQGLNEKGIQV